VLAGLAARRFSVQEYIDALFAWQQRWKPINALISQDLPGIKVAAERSETLPRDR
jgi:hypothetical protein